MSYKVNVSLNMGDKSLPVGKLIPLLPLVTSLLFFLYFLEKSTVIMLLGIILMYIPLLLTTAQNNYYILLFYLTNERLFIIPEFPMGIIAVYVIALAIKIIVSSNFRIKKIIFMNCIVITIFMFIKGFFIPDQLLNTEIIRFMLNLYIFFYILSINKGQIRKLARDSIIWFSSGAIVTSILSMIHKIITEPGFIFSGYRFSALNQDPNYYGLSVAVSISFLIIMLITENKRSNNKLLTAILILFLFGFMTQSRAFILLSIPNIILLFWAFNKINVIRKIIMIFIIFLGVFLMYNFGFFEIVQRSLERFEYTGMNDIRIELWKYYLSELTQGFSNILFGLGTFSKESGISLAPHNFLIGSVVYYGGILTLLFINTFLLTYGQFKKEFSRQRWRLYYYIPLIVIMGGYMFLDGITDNLLFYSFCIWLLTAYLLEGKISNKIGRN